MFATCIKWDTDGYSAKELGLPKEVELPDDLDEEDVADWLSDTYGWCVEAYCYEEK